MQPASTNRTKTRERDARNVRAVLMAQLQELEIVKRIEQARIESGLSQEEMAALLEVANRTYWNYENNRVPYKLMGRIAEVTGRSLRWLLHGEDDAEPSMQVMLQLAAMERKLDQILGRESAGTVVTDLADAVDPPSTDDESEQPPKRKPRPRGRPPA